MAFYLNVECTLTQKVLLLQYKFYSLSVPTLFLQNYYCKILIAKLLLQDHEI